MPRANQHRPQAWGTLFSRLIDRTETPENDQACWTWKGQLKKRYPSFDVMMYRKQKTIRPHRAILVILECGEDTHLFPDLYNAYTIAGFEADHLCFGNPLCVNPDHLQWLTKDEHDIKSNTERHPDQGFNEEW